MGWSWVEIKKQPFCICKDKTVYNYPPLYLRLARSFRALGFAKIKCLKECSTFPCPDMMLPSSSSDEEADASPSKQSPRENYSCSVFLPAPPKHVSAMKGGREKEGGSQMKLTVTWAPDVSDPVSYSKRGSSKGKLYRNRWLHSHDEVFEASSELDDLNAVNHDSYYGTSYYLKTSFTQRFTGLLETRCNMLGCVVY
ncbi:hypothetical protein HKD37_13G035978 [Glycine soja]